MRRPAETGTVVVERLFEVGDELTLSLPMTPRWTWPDPRIDAVRGCVAVERGPLVLCAESVDLPGGRHVDLVRVDPSVRPRDDEGRVVVTSRLLDPADAPWPYFEDRDDGPAAGQDAELPLVLYNSWANRGPSTMRVWLPTTDR